jgi:hypothetical protein
MAAHFDGRHFTDELFGLERNDLTVGSVMRPLANHMQANPREAWPRRQLQLASAGRVGVGANLEPNDFARGPGGGYVFVHPS